MRSDNSKNRERVQGESAVYFPCFFNKVLIFHHGSSLCLIFLNVLRMKTTGKALALILRSITQTILIRSYSVGNWYYSHL